MKIQAINNINTQQVKKNHNTITPRNSVLQTNALMQDTVSFKATAKLLTSRANGINMQLAKEIHEEILPLQKKVKKFLNKNFGDMIATEDNPKKPILFIKDRAKTADSIAEKAATRSLRSKQEVLENLTDLNGGKLVLRDGSRGHVEHVLARFIPLIKNGEVEILEIENKRPNSLKNNRAELLKHDYASEHFLMDLKKTQDKINKRNNSKKEVRLDMNDFTFANYMAIHILFRIAGTKRPAELIVLGKNINTLKTLDDLLYKILNNKNVKKKYKPLKDIIEPLTKDENAAQKDRFNQYRGEAFLFQREKTPTAFSKEEGKEFFLPLRCDLPAEYDLNNLYRIMLECDEKEEETLRKQNSTTGKIKKISKAVTSKVKSKIKKVFTHKNKN